MAGFVAELDPGLAQNFELAALMQNPVLALRRVVLLLASRVCAKDPGAASRLGGPAAAEARKCLVASAHMANSFANSWAYSSAGQDRRQKQGLAAKNF